MRSRILWNAAFLISICASQCLAFGDKGHRAVGAIADERIKGTPTEGKVSTLLGITLAEGALIADTLKDFDAVHSALSVPGISSTLRQQLVDFLDANPQGAVQFDHHVFHYVDIPVGGSSLYDSGTEGRSSVDVVQMINYCIAVLDGSEPATNARKITKPVALILLTHYVGDLHQPLHVGAQYFNNTGVPINPDTTAGQPNGDKGGGTLTLHLLDTSGVLHSKGVMHGYWDSKAVTTAFGLVHVDILAALGGGHGVSDADVAKFLAKDSNPPPSWVPPSGAANGWSKAWANGMMPTAETAHIRLTYSGIHVNTHSHTASGQASETATTAGMDSYEVFAGKVTRTNIHTAGWRLAHLVKTLLP